MRRGIIFLLEMAILALGQSGFSQSFDIPLWPDGIPAAEKTIAEPPLLSVWLPRQGNGAAVVIFPGGGYWGLAKDHEGRQPAQWLNELGLAAIVVSYRRGPGAEHPVPLLDAQRALRTVRAKASEWKIDPRRVGVLGFSAGGHLASCTGVFFDEGSPDDQDPVNRFSCRPDFLILLYPVITMSREYAHQGSRRNLLGETPDPRLAESMSTDMQVSPRTTPTFIVIAADDDVVPEQNALSFYFALRKAGVPAELHIFEKGGHGFGLAPFHPVLSKWTELCRNWLQQRGFFCTMAD